MIARILEIQLNPNSTIHIHRALKEFSVNERPIRNTVFSYEGVSKSFQTESITKYTLTTIRTR
jgi:hypothetical protein